jgi:serine phosphatase RsbU (regulator of sigma subunit)
VQVDRGRCSILRFTGSSTPEMVKWLSQSLRGFRHAIALNVRNLAWVEAPFVQKVLDHAGRRHPIALVDPPEAMVEILAQLCALDKVPIFSSETAILEDGSIPDSMAQEQMALKEIDSRFRINPLWRRIDQEGTWLCAMCGLEVDDVKVSSGSIPGPVALRRVRRHFLEECMAWRAGRQVPLSASVLDAFLAEVNKRKAGDDAERRRSKELEALQVRVDSMQHLQRSVDQARNRQLHLIPVEPEADAIADIAVVYRPLQAVSGDFLDFYALDGNRFGVSIGDVSGHGVETAIIMGMAKMAFRIHSQALGTVREIMTCANRDLFTEVRKSAFVTAIFALIDRDLRKMSYAKAGHPRPLLRRATGGCEELEGQGIPLGVDRDARFVAALEERQAQLAVGDEILFYTDGVVEAGPEASQFGMERLREAFLAAPVGATAQAILDSITGTLDSFLASAPFNDDVTLICLKIK